MPVDAIHHDHTVEAIRERLEQGPSASYLRDWVYGGIDGAVTTFAIVAGVVGANLSTGVILVLGAANVVADGFSMAASNYTGTKTEREEFERLKAHEERQIVRDPDGETREIREIFRAKGFTGEDLDRVVEVITADKALWVNTMLTEEYGLPMSERSPTRAALSTFGAFLLCGLVPLLPFIASPWLMERSHAFAWSSLVTGLTFFFIGSAKSRWSLVSWWRSGAETMAIGLGAASFSYIIGYALQSLV
jgi:VIT1/CCC1 family predicted Fe2+/Mn2+ transporter